MADHGHSPISHVIDTEYWEIFSSLFGHSVGIPLPKFTFELFGREFSFQVTKFMILELVAAGLIIAIFVPLARRAAKGDPPRGVWWNLFEALLTFIRDQVAKPTLSPPEDHHEHAHAEPHDESHGHGGHHAKGHDALKGHEYDAYVPFLWTVFLFILFCNLLGMLPFMGSPTASLSVTAALGLISLLMIHGAAVVKMGPWGYLKSLWPPMEVPLLIGIVLKPMIFLIELAGTFIKSGVLAVRLFANMFAGHMVLAMILFFIVSAANLSVAGFAGITLASVLGVTALSLLELFVAFLQAYIFTFLTALFMGMAVNPQH
jgi:F-type H+-transporting ATPase subunit a